MAVALSTAGVKVFYKGSALPEVQIPGITEIPEFNPAPDTLESTTLEDTEYKSYVAGLKDLGGALSFTVNFTQDFITKYDELITAQEAETDKRLTLIVEIPGITKRLEVKGEFSALGMPSIGVNQVLQSNFFFTPSDAPAWIAKA